LARCFEALDNYHRINVTNGQLYRENERLSAKNQHLSQENDRLKAENRDYGLLAKVFGKERLNELVEQAKQERQAKQQEKRLRRSRDYER
jgi:regulator of replication initiation timing